MATGGNSDRRRSYRQRRNPKGGSGRKEGWLVGCMAEFFLVRRPAVISQSATARLKRARRPPPPGRWGGWGGQQLTLATADLSLGYFTSLLASKGSSPFEMWTQSASKRAKPLFNQSAIEVDVIGVPYPTDASSRLGWASLGRASLQIPAVESGASGASVYREERKEEKIRLGPELMRCFRRRENLKSEGGKGGKASFDVPASSP